MGGWWRSRVQIIASDPSPLAKPSSHSLAFPNMYGDSFFPGVIKRLMGLTEGVDMDTLVTIILADALICPYQSPLPISRRRLPVRGGPSASREHRHRKGGIAQLVERRPCNWVVVFAGWMLNLLSGNDSIVYRNRWLTFS